MASEIMAVRCVIPERCVVFSSGADEIFGGYERFTRATQLNSDCYSALLKMYERDLYRDDVVSMEHSIELRVPYLDKALVDYILKVPPMYKIYNGRREKIEFQLKYPT